MQHMFRNNRKHPDITTASKSNVIHSLSLNIFVMETSKEERPVVAKKRPFVKEDESVEAKSRRTENLDSQESKDDEQII